MGMDIGSWQVGGGLQYPYELAVKLTASKFDRDDILDLISETKKIYDEYKSERSNRIQLQKDLELAEHTIRLLQSEGW